MNAACAMKGRLASRAHSFKENLLEALGHHSPDKEGRGSADNLLSVAHTDAMAAARPEEGADSLVRELQLALKFVEDAVNNNKLELVPSAVSVLLERVLNVQVYVCRNPRHASTVDEQAVRRSRAALQRLYVAVAGLVKWADHVIVGASSSSSATHCSDLAAWSDSIRLALSSLSKEIDQGHRRRRASSYSQAPEPHLSASFSSIDYDLMDRGRRTVAATTSKTTPRSVATSLATTATTSSPPPLPPKSTLTKTRRVRENERRPRLDWFANPLFSSSSLEDNNSTCSREHLNVDYTTDEQGSSTSLRKKALESQMPFADDVTDSSYDISRDQSFTDVDTDSSLTSRLETVSSSSPSQVCSSPSKRRSWQLRSSNMEHHYDDYSASIRNQIASETPPVVKLESGRRSLLRHLQQPSARTKQHMLVSSLSFDCTGISRPEPIDVARAHLREMDRSPCAPDENHALRSMRRLEHRFSEKDMSHPPPLPPKKRDIVCYMELLGNIKLPSREELLQSLPHTQVLLQNVWTENYHSGFGEFVPDNRDFHFPFAQDKFVANVDLSRMQINAPTAFPSLDDEGEQKPPALPPKRNRLSQLALNSSSTALKERFVPIVRVSDGKIVNEMDILTKQTLQQEHAVQQQDTLTANIPASNNDREEGEQKSIVVSVPVPKRSASANVTSTPTYTMNKSVDSTPKSSSSSSSSSSSAETSTVLTLICIDEEKGCDRFSSLVYANNNDGLTELRAGNVDELIILATESATKNFVYQDAFILTYRTFIPTLELLSKLEFRFRHFNNKEDPRHLRAARSSFSLLVRVVDSLLECDFSEPSVASNLSLFIAELIEQGNLMLARALRMKFIEKHEELKAKQMPVQLSTAGTESSPTSILLFKSSELAEQITLLDARLFWKLEPEELLLWVKEQNEEKSPNLAAFTKHFNAMSYWCRTQILQEKDHRERERLVAKFIKIMKLLRKHNNFNSFLSLLSALDSASIRRLEWSRATSETIREFSALIDFSGSFKAYREALSRAKPPVIPYMGLVLQDLTFVHIGNNDNVKGRVNFAKRWQQYNILHNVRRFKSCSYTFSRNEEIVRAFDNFDDALSDNELWLLSETLKPRIKTDSKLTVDSHAPADEKLT